MIELKCPCLYWKCGYWNSDTNICEINNRDCFDNREERGLDSPL